MAPTFAEEIAGAVLRHYLNTGNVATVADIAPGVGAERHVRRALRAGVPGVERLAAGAIFLPTHSALRDAFLKAAAGIVAIATSKES